MAVARHDVREFFQTEIGAETGLGDDYVGKLERHLVRQQRIVAVGDVPKRTGVHQGGLPFHGLHDVGKKRLLEQHGHRPGHPKVLGGDEAAVLSLANDDAPDPLTEILEVTRQGEDGHDLRCGRDDETRLAWHAVLVATEAGDDVPQGTIVDIQRPRPGDKARADIELPVENSRIDHRRQQVVGGFDGVDVAGEVQVDLLHRDDLRQAAASAAALDPEQRPGRRLSQAERRIGADPTQALGQADGARGFAFAGAGWRDRSHDDEATIWPVLEPLENVEADLCFVGSVGNHFRFQ